MPKGYQEYGEEYALRHADDIVRDFRTLSGRALAVKWFGGKEHVKDRIIACLRAKGYDLPLKRGHHESKAGEQPSWAKGASESNPGAIQGPSGGRAEAEGAAVPEWAREGIEFQVTEEPSTPQKGRLAQVAVAGSVAASQERREASEPTVEIVSAPVLPSIAELGKQEYERLKALSRNYLEKRRDNPPDLVVYRIKSETPILICSLADLHLGGEGTDHDKAEEDALLLTRTPGAFAFFGGDGIDNFIKHQAAMLKATSNPSQQYAALGYWLSLFDASPRSRLLGGVAGNHSQWTGDIAGIDFLKQLFREREIVYHPARLRVRLEVNDIPYRIELRHSYRFRSSINLSNQFLRCWELSDWEWDIACHGHSHAGPFIVPFDRHGIRRWGCLSGAYKVIDSYAQQWGFNNAIPTSPAFVLDHQQRRITGFDDLRTGLEVLKALRTTGGTV